jgi:hypothetical protein
VLRIFVSLLIVVAVPSLAWTDWRQFVPQTYESNWELQIDAACQSNENKVNGKGFTATSSALTERLVFTGVGVIYHPRFIQWLVKLGGGLDENKCSGPSCDDSSWNLDSVVEYELRAVVLPEHPYNLEVWTLRRMPFTQVQFSTQPLLTDTETGAIFKYKKKPYRLTLSYNDTTLDSGFYTTDTKTFLAAAGHSKEGISTSASYQHGDSSTDYSNGTTDYKTDNFSLLNEVNLFQGNANLQSILTQNNFEQTGGGFSLDDRRFTWTQQLYLQLPANFSVNASYYWYDDKENTKEDAGSSVDQKFTTLSSNISITQRLFQSLTSVYSYQYQNNDSLTGEVESTTHSLGLNYIKRIPWGRLIASFVADKITTDRTGTASVINEIHNAPVFGDFTLNRPFVDVPTINIRVKSPVSGTFVQMVANINYLVEPLGSFVRIRIISVPPEALQPNPSFSYEFSCDYSLIGGDFRLIQKDLGYTLKFELFDNLISPYYNYYRTRQDVASGFLPGGPEDATTKTVGIQMQKQPFDLMVEYQDYESNFSPSQTLRSELRFQRDVAETANIYLRGYYARIKYLEAPSNPLFIPYTENLAGGDFTLNKRFRHNLNLAVSAAYGQRTGVFTSKAYSLNSLLRWAYGKLDLSLQVNLNRVESEVNDTNQKTLYQYYYLMIRRKLT